MFAKKTHFDCLVIGGGPVGCILAATLSYWGKRVCLLDRDFGPNPFPLQAISHEATALLKRNGLMTSVRKHGSERSNKRQLQWGDGLHEDLTLKKGQEGYRVNRDAMDPDLRNLARAMKVSLFEDASILSALPESGSGNVAFQQRGKPFQVHADVIVMATGRKHPLDLIPLALEHAAPDLFAFTASLLPKNNHRPFDTISSLPQGWAWMFHDQKGSSQVSLFSPIRPQDWRASLSLAEEITKRTWGKSVRVDYQSARYLNVTPRLVSTKSGVLLLGDAALTTDPLTGRGLESSISAAEASVVAINTMIEQPQIRAECARHLVAQEKQRYFDNLSEALGLYLREVRFSDHPFWASRHQLCQVEIESAAPSELPTRLKIAEEVGLYPTMKRKGRLLERVVGMGKPGGEIHQTALGISVSALLDLVAEIRWTDDVIVSCGRHPSLYVHSRSKITRALSELCRMGILEAGETGPKDGLSEI